ncbi:MAG: hypothetical protein IPG38_11045 [Chitinophagaceae bacterium]|nr:hypothetical protein [Chitinophagaceae bacterium]
MAIITTNGIYQVIIPASVTRLPSSVFSFTIAALMALPSFDTFIKTLSPFTEMEYMDLSKYPFTGDIHIPFPITFVHFNPDDGRAAVCFTLLHHPGTAYIFSPGSRVTNPVTTTLKSTTMNFIYYF